MVISFIGRPPDLEYRCRMNRIAREMISECISELSGIGFYDFTPIEDRQRARLEPKANNDGGGYVFEYTNRLATVDTEDVQETGIGCFLEDVSHLPPCSTIISDFINESRQNQIDVVEFVGVRCEVWNTAEFADNPPAWLLAQDRAIKMMNTLLSLHGYADRLYYQHFGNDDQVILVTPTILSVLVKYGAVTANSI